jgi:hypothetical protein
LKFLRKYTNVNDADSLSNKFRRKRIEIFRKLLNKYKSPVKILDLGGTQEFWENMDLISEEFQITIVNTELIDIKYKNFISIKKDARDLSEFRNKEFDIVFSNSLIEHVGNFPVQKILAEEISRIGKSYFIQTPNYYFPLEPHFLFPYFQLLPKKLRIYLLCHFNLGWFKKSEKSEAVKIINSITLLKYNELKELFPSALIIREKFSGITKSFICIYN